MAPSEGKGHTFELCRVRHSATIRNRTANSNLPYRCRLREAEIGLRPKPGARGLQVNGVRAPRRMTSGNSL